MGKVISNGIHLVGQLGMEPNDLERLHVTELTQ